MGQHIAQKNGQYRVWSTISDQWLTDWCSREEILAFLYDEALYEFKKQIIEQHLSFLHHWYSHDKHAYINGKERNEQHHQWIDQLLEKHGEEYDQFVDEMFERVKSELGIVGDL